MTRIFENRQITRTSNISMVVLVVVIVFGFWDLWSAFGGGEPDTTSAMFGVLFVGGGLIGGYTIWNDGRDQVQWFDVDLEAGKCAVAVWRPIRPLVFDLDLSQVSEWRHWVKVGKRNMRTHYLVAALPGYPRPVYFEMPQDRTKEIPAGFRDIAPEAVEDFEINSGRTRDGEKDDDAAAV